MIAALLAPWLDALALLAAVRAQHRHRRPLEERGADAMLDRLTR